MNVLSSSTAKRRGSLIVLGMVGLLIALAATPAFAGTQAPRVTDEERAAALTRPAIVFIETYWSAYVFDDDDWHKQTWSSRCSGFVVNPTGYIVTAGHCVDDGLEGARMRAITYTVDDLIGSRRFRSADRADWLEYAFENWEVEGKGAGSPPDRTVYMQRGVAKSGLRDGTARPARVVEVLSLSKGDVALLKVEEANLPTISIASDADVQIGTEVLSVGYPATSDRVTDATFEPTFKDGKISSKKTRDGGLLPVYEVSAALSAGMSGGPTVDMSGRVVGLNSFIPAGEAQPFNFLSPASVISEVLNRNGVSNKPSPTDSAYRSGLQALFAGDYSKAMEQFDQVLDLAPAHQQAQEFRLMAAERAAAQPKESPMMLIIAVAGGAVLIFGASGLLIARRGRRRRRDAAVVTPPSVPAPQMTEQLVPVGVGQPDGLATVGFRPGQPDGEAAAMSFEPITTPLARSARRFCPHCGAEANNAHRFCASCGKALG